MDLYFKRHDGQAVTCDDFRAAMADANGEDLTGLAAWYSQAGEDVSASTRIEYTYRRNGMVRYLITKTCCAQARLR